MPNKKKAIKLILSYPSWFLIFCAIAAGVYSCILYWKNNPVKNDKTIRWVYPTIFTLRALSVFLISFLLLAPFIKIKTTNTEEPTIAILVDNSLSLSNDKNFKKALFEKSIEKLSRKLGDKFKVSVYGFGDNLQRDSLYTFNEKVTNIAGALEALDDEQYNRNLVSCILASDGLYNEGINPLYQKTNGSFTINTILMGDTSIKRDIRIAHAAHNQFVYLGDKTTIEVDVEADDCRGAKTSVDLFQVINGKQLKLNSAQIEVNKGSFAKTIQLGAECKSLGLNHYRLAVNPLSNEVTYKNNVRDIFVEVIDGRKKILIAGAAPHPDITAIRQTLEGSKNYTVSVDLTGDALGNLQEYQLLVLHQIPSLNKSNEEYIRAAIAKQIPILFVLGTQSNFARFNSLQDGFAIEKRGESKQDILPIYNDNFQLFTLSDELKNELIKMPNLEIPFSSVSIKNTGSVLLYQKIGNVKTDFPMISFYDNGMVKMGYIFGEGIWRWKLNNYRLNNNHLVFDELMLKVFNQLAVKRDNRPFRVIQPKQLYQEGELITFDAQLYNGAFELINSSSASINIVDSKGKEYKYVFGPKEKYYHVSCGYFPEGEYTFRASTQFNGKTYICDGQFMIAPRQLEFVNVTADHNLLRTMAQKRNGKAYSLQQIDQLAEELLNQKEIKTYLYDTFSTNPLIDLWQVLLLIIGLLSLEWILRKWSGTY